MQHAVAAIRAGTAARTGLAGRASAALHRRHLGPSGGTDRSRAAFPTFHAGRGGQWTYHGPGQRIAYVMLDLTGRTARVPARDVRCYVHGLEEWLIRALDRFGVRGERREGRVGIWVADPPRDRGQDRRHRRARHALGELARRRAERRAGPQPLRRHRALRHQRTRRHQPARARHSGDHGRGRRRAARRVGRGVRPVG